MTLEASGMLAANKNIQYLHILVRGEVLHQFDTLSSEVGFTNSENLKNIILGLGTYFFPVNALSKQKRAMRRVINKQKILKVRRYNACMIELT